MPTACAPYRRIHNIRFARGATAFALHQKLSVALFGCRVEKVGPVLSTPLQKFGGGGNYGDDDDEDDDSDDDGAPRV